MNRQIGRWCILSMTLLFSLTLAGCGSDTSNGGGPAVLPTKWPGGKRPTAVGHVLPVIKPGYKAPASG